jgi:hypothetical protein
MLIDGEALPKPLTIDETFAALERSTIQAIRASGIIRKGSEDIAASSTAYVGVLFSLPPGQTGAIIGAPKSVSIKGDCHAIKHHTSQPSISQLLAMGAVHRGTLPRDLAPEFRHGHLKLHLQVGGRLFEQDDPKPLACCIPFHG